jgi:hypothetical protein
MDNQITIDATEYRLLVEAQVRLNVVSNLEIEERYLSTDTILHILGLHTKEEVDGFTKAMQNATAANLRRQIADLQSGLDNLTGNGETVREAAESVVEVTA